MNGNPWSCSLALTVLLVTLTLLALFVDDDVPQRTSLYGRLLDHPWNRLNAALLIRRTVDGRAYGTNELDPLVWDNSQHLFVGESHERAVRLFDRFLHQFDDRLIEDPVQRAVMQHDLWGLFDWLADPASAAFPEQRRKLRLRIAAAIQRLALSAEDIGRLPDNFAAATARRSLEGGFAAQPPDDLFDQDGSWVQLGYESDARIGTAHEESSMTQGRSAFSLLARLPDNRSLGRVLSQFNTWADEESQTDTETRRRRRFAGFQFPAGTQLALVRRMLVVDDQAQVRPTRITERVQMRELLPAGRQRFALFVLNRPQLLSGRLGTSLSAVERHERGFELGPVRTPVAGDPFESAWDPLPPTLLMQSCSQCHKDHSLLCLSRDGFSALGSRPVSLRLAQQGPLIGQATADWKMSRREFAALRSAMRLSTFAPSSE